MSIERMKGLSCATRASIALAVALGGLALTAGSARAQAATIDSVSVLVPSCGGLQSPRDFSGRIRATITITDCTSDVVATVAPGSGGLNICHTAGVGTHEFDFQYIPRTSTGSTVVVRLAVKDGFSGPILDSNAIAFNCTTGGPSACATTPLSGCRAAGLSKLKSKKPRLRPEQDRFSWTWSKGDATNESDFDDPTSTTAYNLCIYNGDELRAVREFPPDPEAWKPASGGYKRSEHVVGSGGSKLGQNSVRLRAGEDGKSMIVVRESRVTAPDPTFPFEAPVTVQLVNADNGACWESVFEEDDLKKNQTDKYSEHFSEWGYSKSVAKR